MEKPTGTGTFGRSAEFDLAWAYALQGDPEDERLLPATPDVVAMTPLISSLDAVLEELFPVAANHYQQAVDSYVSGNHEAANGQIRSFLENLIIELGQAHGGTHSNPHAALQHLRNLGQLDDDEWQLFRGLWSAVQDNGPHHGMTSPEEALLRLHFSTAAARYLVARTED